MAQEEFLTFELDRTGDQLHLHGNAAGLRRLARLLETLAADADRGESEHRHLFTEAWGGSDLSNAAKTPGAKPLQHVKIYGWTKD